MCEGFTVAGIVDTVIVDRGKPGQDPRTANEGKHPLGVAEDRVRVQGMALDRKLLKRVDMLPRKITRLGETRHLGRVCRKWPGAFSEFAIEKGGEAAIAFRLGFGD